MLQIKPWKSNCIVSRKTLEVKVSVGREGTAEGSESILCGKFFMGRSAEDDDVTEHLVNTLSTSDCCVIHQRELKLHCLIQTLENCVSLISKYINNFVFLTKSPRCKSWI